MCWAEILEYTKAFQTLIVGILGFGGVVLTLNRNAGLARGLQERQNTHEANALRTALRAELTTIRDALKFRIETIDETQPGQGVFVPTTSMVHAYSTLLPRIGLLSEREIGRVMEAYALVGQLIDRAALFAHPMQATESKSGFIFIPPDALKPLRMLHDGYLAKVGAALNALH